MLQNCTVWIKDRKRRCRQADPPTVTPMTAAFALRSTVDPQLAASVEPIAPRILCVGSDASLLLQMQYQLDSDYDIVIAASG